MQGEQLAQGKTAHMMDMLDMFYANKHMRDKLKKQEEKHKSKQNESNKAFSSAQKETK